MACPDLPRFQSGADAWSNPVRLPRGTGCGIRLRTDRPTHPAWEGWLPAPTTGTAEILSRSLDGTATLASYHHCVQADSFMYLKTLTVLARPLLQVLSQSGWAVMRGSFMGTLSQPISSVFCPQTWGQWSPGVLGSCPAGEIPPQSPHIRFPQKDPPVPLGWPCPSLGQSSPSQESRYRLGQRQTPGHLFQIGRWCSFVPSGEKAYSSLNVK